VAAAGTCPACYGGRPILPCLCDRRTAVGKMSDQGRWCAQRVQRPRMRPDRHMAICFVYVAYRVNHARADERERGGWVAAVRCSMSGRAVPRRDRGRHGFHAVPGHAVRGHAVPGQGCPAACRVFRDGASRGGYGGARPLVVVRIRGALWGIRGSSAAEFSGDRGGRPGSAHYHVARVHMWSMTSSWLP
jgi:hypothetical protein